MVLVVMVLVVMVLVVNGVRSDAGNDGSCVGNDGADSDVGSDCAGSEW